MNYHKSLSTLPIANFNAIKENNNLCYLFGCDFLDCENQKVKPEMADVWDELETEYADVISKRKLSSTILDLKYEMMEMITQREIVLMCCNQILIDNNVEFFVEELNNTDYPINTKKELKTQIERITHRVDNLISKANANQIEIDKLSNIGDPSTFEEMLSAIEDNSKKNINPFTITVKQWLVEEDKFIKSVEKQKNKKHNGRR